MKVYQYWRQEAEKGQVRRGKELVPYEITCYGGSNRSPEDASAQARQKIDQIKRKIAGESCVFEDYEVEIREEVLASLSEKAVITRNRYGARVLNAETLMILDIDKPRLSFWDMFKKWDSKTKITEMVRKLAQKAEYARLAFRIYETQKGIRVIVLGQDFDPKTQYTQKMMQEFNCDQLYALLCARQACFRARLSPKPSVMKMRGKRVRYPRAANEEADLQAWLAEYEAKSSGFSVCKFIEQVGAPQPPNEVVRYHDEQTGAFKNTRLA